MTGLNCCKDHSPDRLWVFTARVTGRTQTLHSPLKKKKHLRQISSIMIALQKWYSGFIIFFNIDFWHNEFMTWELFLQ